MRDDAFYSVLERIEDAQSLPKLERAIMGLIDIYGFAHAGYHALRLPNDPRENPVVIHSYPEQWISRYRSQRYFEIDPVVLQAARSILPVDWDRLSVPEGTPQLLFREALDFGIGRKGLTVPIRGARGDLAVFTVVSALPDHEWQSLKLAQTRDIQLIGNYVHHRVLALCCDDDEAPIQLSRRERECLQWAAAGATIAGTAERLHVSERAVRGYLDSARHKLSSLTKAQAVARAIALGIVEH